MKIYRATIPVIWAASALFLMFPGPLARTVRTVDRFARRLVPDLAAVCQTGLREDLVAPIYGELALVESGLEEVEQIARIHLAGVVGERRRQIDRTDDLHALVLH